MHSLKSKGWKSAIQYLLMHKTFFLVLYKHMNLLAKMQFMSTQPTHSKKTRLFWPEPIWPVKPALASHFATSITYIRQVKRCYHALFPLYRGSRNFCCALIKECKSLGKFWVFKIRVGTEVLQKKYKIA